MTTEQTAEQLELAAQILRTGHPWESSPQAPDTDIYSALRDGFKIRPILATPPDNRPLHNPNNLTAEQVGIGYRLMTLDEKLNTKTDLQTKWKDGGWCWCGEIYGKLDHKTHPTYRLPLSVPWSEPGDTYANLRAAHAAGKVIEWRFKDGSKQWIAKTANFNEFSSICEYRIKPEPIFQLPPCAPGMRWHREDGWKAEDLPQGYRPHIEEEADLHGDEIKSATTGKWEVVEATASVGSNKNVRHRRTTRPLTFTHAEKQWTWHRPGDPMPCDGEAFVDCLCDNEGELSRTRAKVLLWQGDIIGWRYADEKKTVPLGPEDVPPCCAFRRQNESRDYIMSTSVYVGGIYGHDEIVFRHTWEYLKEHYQINRSIPLTGKWNPDAWEPCHKIISENG